MNLLVTKFPICSMTCIMTWIMNAAPPATSFKIQVLNISLKSFSSLQLLKVCCCLLGTYLEIPSQLPFFLRIFQNDICWNLVKLAYDEMYSKHCTIWKCEKSKSAICNYFCPSKKTPLFQVCTMKISTIQGLTVMLFHYNTINFLVPKFWIVWFIFWTKMQAM